MLGFVASYTEVIMWNEVTSEKVNSLSLLSYLYIPERLLLEFGSSVGINIVLVKKCKYSFDKVVWSHEVHGGSEKRKQQWWWWYHVRKLATSHLVRNRNGTWFGWKPCGITTRPVPALLLVLSNTCGPCTFPTQFIWVLLKTIPPVLLEICGYGLYRIRDKPGTCLVWFYLSDVKGLGEGWYMFAGRWYLSSKPPKGLGLPADQMQSVSAFANIPWQVKSIYGILSDTFPINGYHRTPYIVIAGVFGLFSWTLLWLNPTSSVAIAAILLRK